MLKLLITILTSHVCIVYGFALAHDVVFAIIVFCARWGGSVHTNRSHIRARALCLLHYPSLGFFWAKNCKMSIIVRDKIALLHYPKSRSFQKIIVKKSNSWTQNFHFFHTSIKLQYAVTKPSDILIFGLRNIELVKCSQLKSEGAHFFFHSLLWCF